MAKKYNKKARHAKRDKTSLIVLSILLGLFFIIGLLVWKEIRPGVGTKITALRLDHVNEGEPVESPSDPPTSGSHYGRSMPAGFYTENSPEYQSGDHDGYIIHSLEHGYIVFWYNCALLDDQGCSDLLTSIKTTMDEFNNYKLIAIPRPSITHPLVMTSWEHLQEFESYNENLAKKFIRVNRPLSPEPNAP